MDNINKTKTKYQKGQAIMEMCVCMIPILVVLLGMIVISGLGISNIQAFLQAKANAEIASRNINAVGGAGEAIHSWDYSDDGLPFTADDEAVNFSQVNAERNTQEIADIMLNRPYYSEYPGYFLETNSILPENPYNIPQDMNYNYAADIPYNMLAAAALVSGKANTNLNTVFTLGANNGETRNITPAFTALFGIDLDDIDLESMKANTVYYPAMPTAVLINEASE